MDFDWTPEQRRLAAEAAEVAGDAVTRFGAHCDAWMTGYSRAFSKELAGRGWIGMGWPVEHGGGGRPPLDRFIVSEAMLTAGAPIAATWFADRQIGPSLIAFGTEEQRRRFLPGILAGETTWCIGMSEPGAGSDVASLRTRARRTGGGWVVDGQKTWTSFAAGADFCYLICRTGDGTGHRGISELIVPMDTPGVTVRPIVDMAGGRHFCEVFFDGVEVPADNLVGAEGAAFGQTMRQLEHERGGVDRLLSNRLLYDAALPHADVSKAEVRQEIARLETGYRVGRLLVLRETARQGPAGFSAVTKAFCTSHEQRVAAFVSHTLGLPALAWDGLGRGLAYSPSYTIMGGTSEVLRNIIAERMLKLPRENKVYRSFGILSG
ncbi:acyl-CoA dehydrogenase [Acrocarpospora pleiomorpha]|uniref:Acyl-CoA dehydrogenase n=1 Tax=Acrocarpospora pleiomorpha TaxID=90975 RepID=A0A5M3XGV9_9ACTN|nr:acyl-CoA dehydrogenase family protein [Acrocarpospora pleiomorpha]GES17318.1 acyl-CoA dehydrogenase [Acrocarpospora pleiomorpha]